MKFQDFEKIISTMVHP